MATYFKQGLMRLLGPFADLLLASSRTLPAHVEQSLAHSAAVSSRVEESVANSDAIAARVEEALLSSQALEERIEHGVRTLRAVADRIEECLWNSKALPRRIDEHLAGSTALPDILIEECLKRSSALPRIVTDLLVDNPSVAAVLQPYQEDYPVCTPRTPEDSEGRDEAGVAIPPRELWESYGPTAADYLAAGREQVARMREVLAAAGAPLESAGRILDFTCGAGRALRWLTELAAARFADASGPDRREIWGTDVSAPHVVWLRQHLCPPLRAATRSTNPHLPFEDRYFDLIWSLTPFGRPPDLADAWLLELRRVLRPGGKLYLAVLDKEAFEKLSDPQIETDGNQALLRAAFALQELQALLKSDFASLAVPTPLGIVVVYDRDYLLGAWEREWRLVSATPRASGPCMAYLLERI